MEKVVKRTFKIFNFALSLPDHYCLFGFEGSEYVSLLNNAHVDINVNISNDNYRRMDCWL